MKNKTIILSLTSIILTANSYARNDTNIQTQLWNKAEHEILNKDEIELIKKSDLKYKNKSLRRSSFSTSMNNSIVNYGFNVLSQEPTNYNCLSGDGARVIPNFSKVVDGKVVTSTEEINEFFEMNTSAGANGGLGKFSASGSYKKKITREFRELKKATTVAFSIRNQTQEKITNIWPELSPRASKLLKAGSNASKINFRNLCGDAVISSAIYGKEIAVLIQVESKTSEVNKSKEVAKDISASYGGLVGGSASKSTIEKYRRYQDDYNFKIKAYIVGDETVISDSNLLNFKNKLVEFESNDSKVLSPIRFETSEYLNPTDKLYWDTFLDYREFGRKVDKWESFMDFEYAPRCPSTSLNQLCVHTENKYYEVIEKCENARSWKDCLTPEQSQCVLLNGDLCDQLSRESYSTWKSIAKSGGWSNGILPDKVLIPKEATRVKVTFDRIMFNMFTGKVVKYLGKQSIVINWRTKEIPENSLINIQGDYLVESYTRFFSRDSSSSFKRKLDLNIVGSNFLAVEYEVEIQPN